MYTQCPDCTSVFEISPEHLGAAGGMVQCGVCNTTFNALRRLTENPPETTPPNLSGNDSPFVTKSNTQTDVGEEVAPSVDPETNRPEEPEIRPIDDEATIAADEFSLNSDDDSAEDSTSHSDVETTKDHTTDSRIADAAGLHDSDTSDIDDADVNAAEEALNELLEDLDEDDELVVVNPDDLFSTSQILDEWDIEEGEHDLETLLADESNLDDDESNEEPETSDDAGAKNTSYSDSDSDNAEPEEAVEQADDEPTSDKEDEDDQPDESSDGSHGDGSETDQPATEQTGDEVADEHDSRKAAPSEAEELRDLEELEDLDELDEFDEEDLSEQDLIDADLNDADPDDLVSDDDENGDNEDSDPNNANEDGASDEAQDTDKSDGEIERSNSDGEINDDETEVSSDDDEDRDPNTIDEDESSDEAQDTDTDKSDEEAQDTDTDKSDEEVEKDKNDEAYTSSNDDEKNEHDAVTPDRKDDVEAEERGDTEPDSSAILTAGVDGQFDDDYSDAEDLKDLGHYLTPKKSFVRRLGEGSLALLLAGLLAAQYIHHNRTELATHPKFGAHIRNAYSTLGKDLQANWKVADYRVARHTIVPDDDNADILMARATIVNNSGSERPLPLIRLQLKNRWGDAIYGRVFTPGEYLDGSTPDTLAGNGKLEVTLDLVHPAPDEEIGYSFDVCLDTPAGPDCGTPQVFTE